MNEEATAQPNTGWGTIPPEKRTVLAKKYLDAWEPGDNAWTIGGRFSRPHKYIVEVLQEQYAVVSKLVKKQGMSPEEIAAETGLPLAFVEYACHAVLARKKRRKKKAGPKVTSS